MKVLMLMRHAKSSWKNSKLEDKERPLNRRGEKDAEKMAAMLADKELMPDLIMTSNARRARQTAGEILKVCRGEITYMTLDPLYMAEPGGIIENLQCRAGSANRVIVIGHNPGLENLLQRLTGQVESLPTSSIAYLEMPIDDWSKISLETNATTFEKWTPKKA